VAGHAFTTGDPDLIATTILDGGSAGSVVRFVDGETRDAVLTGFTVTGGDAAYGGGRQRSPLSLRTSHVLDLQ
jgi:hypothetical protein